MEKIKSAEELMQSLAKIEFECAPSMDDIIKKSIAIIKERDRQICDAQKRKCYQNAEAFIGVNDGIIISEGSIINAFYPEGIRKEEDNE